MDLKQYMPDTEQRNPRTLDIDTLPTLDMLAAINREDQLVAAAVQTQLPQIAQIVDLTEKTIRGGGRVVYIGAGTSGRLGVLDASECPPTYGVPRDMFMGLIAGGEDALVRSSEGKEDLEELGRQDLAAISFSQKDMLIGLAASGRTPYVMGALRYAGELGAATASVVCSQNAPMAALSQVTAALPTGPEAVTGSTRMKAGTAQKMALNMISTATMIRLGKVYGNLMVDVSASNEKLMDRALRIVQAATGCAPQRAQEALAQADHSVKTAIVMIRKDLFAPAARQLLAENEGRIAQALGEAAL